MENKKLSWDSFGWALLDVDDRRLQVSQFEWIADIDSNIWGVYSLLQETEKEEQLAVVLFVANVRVYGNSIIKIKCEWENGVVYNQHMLSFAVKNDVQILNIKVLQLDTVLAVQSLLEQSFVGVNVVKNLIGILLLPCRENNDFVPLDQLLQNILHVRAQPHLNFCPLEWELEGRFETRGDMAFKFSGNERLIHIEDEESVLCFHA